MIRSSSARLAAALALAPAVAQRRDTLPDSTAIRLPAVEVIGTAASLTRIPGSGLILRGGVLEQSRPVTLTEVLRRAAGINVRDEEGLSLRPNIGTRGLNPTRSTTVLLLEDGIPFTLAPYGDNASYYHPAFERFERIEVLKGLGQILFGPRTVGGVNYVTLRDPRPHGGVVELVGGATGTRTGGSASVVLGRGGPADHVPQRKRWRPGQRRHHSPRRHAQDTPSWARTSPWC
jgi:Fe(3+) dicitrate transport protein